MKPFHEMTFAERLAVAREAHSRSEYKHQLFVDERLIRGIHWAEIEVAITEGWHLPEEVLAEHERRER